ncbi:uncharacterized protein V1518DRAFT_436308 [Limtongia smithiae]|uniref:uncharacterized protein n=1 Tax=Limtongia smithiae TaxID=1125753 RepID=UPI0034CDF0BD
MEVTESMIPTSAIPSSSAAALPPARRVVSSPLSGPTASPSAPTPRSSSLTFARLLNRRSKVGESPSSSSSHSGAGGATAASAAGGADTLPGDALSEFLYSKGFIEGVGSDVLIRAFEKDYHLHRLILYRSPYFSMLFSGKWNDSGSDVIELSFADDPNISVEAFELAVGRLYGHADPGAEAKHAMSLLAVSSFFDIQDLVEYSVNLIILGLSATNIAEVLHFAQNSNYGYASTRLINSCKNILYCEGWELGVRMWDQIPTTIAAEILSGNPFFVLTEWDRCMFVIDLINWHLKFHKPRNQSECDGSDIESVKGGNSGSSIADTVGASSGPRSRETNYELYDVAPLRKTMEGGIHYAHFTFEQVQELDSMTDISGQRVVSSETLRDAVWTSLLLRQNILSCAPENGSLGFLNRGPLPAADSNGRRPAYIIPASDETTVGVGASSSVFQSGLVTSKTLIGSSDDEEEEEVSWTQFPPYRFSLEFRNVSKLREDKRVYSNTIWYAGSYWNVYIQKVKQRKSVVQMGVYLHRARSANPQPALDSAVTVSGMTEQQDGNTNRQSLLEDDITALTTDNPFSDLWLRGTPLDDTTSIMSTTTTTTTTLQSESPSTTLHGGSRPLSVKFSSTRPQGTTGAAASPVSAMPEYQDMRPKISTYFEIFTQSRRGKHAITCFSSSPDMFSFSQSWGWKSTTLCASIDEQQQLATEGQGDDAEVNLKFMIVLGMQ